MSKREKKFFWAKCFWGHGLNRNSVSLLHEEEWDGERNMREGIREGVRWVGRAGMGGFAVFLSSLIQGVRLGGHSLSTQFHLSSFIFICMFPPCASISFLLGASCCLVRDVWTLYFARSSYFWFPFSLSKHHPMLFSFSSTPFISFASLNPHPGLLVILNVFSRLVWFTFAVLEWSGPDIRSDGEGAGELDREEVGSLIEILGEVWRSLTTCFRGVIS